MICCTTPFFLLSFFLPSRLLLCFTAVLTFLPPPLRCKVKIFIFFLPPPCYTLFSSLPLIHPPNPIVYKLNKKTYSITNVFLFFFPGREKKFFFFFSGEINPFHAVSLFLSLFVFFLF